VYVSHAIPTSGVPHFGHDDLRGVMRCGGISTLRVSLLKASGIDFAAGKIGLPDSFVIGVSSSAEPAGASAAAT
jgi:hypothetical protein